MFVSLISRTWTWSPASICPSFAGSFQATGNYGATPIAERAEREGLDLIVPLDNGAAATAECTRTIAAATADKVVDILTGRREPGGLPPSRRDELTDLSRPWSGITDEGLRAREVACARRSRRAERS